MTITGTATDTGGTVAGVEVSTDSGTRGTRPRARRLVLQLERPRLADARRSWSRAIDDSRQRRVPVAERDRQRRLPVHAGRARTRRRPSSTSRTPARSRSASASRPTSTASSPACASTRRRANTGTHVGNLWTTSGTLLATGTFSGETASGWQQLNFTTPVDITAGTTYVASLLRAARALLGIERVLLLAEPGRRELARQPAAARRQCQPRRRQRRLLLRELVDLPDLDLRRRELRRRRRLRAQAAAGCGGQRHGDPGPGSATVNFTAPSTGGLPTRYIVTPFIGSIGAAHGHRDRHPAGDLGEGRRPRRRDVVHVQGPGRQRQRDRPALGRVQRGHADRPSGSGRSHRTSPPAAADQQATVRWTAPNDGGRDDHHATPSRRTSAASRSPRPRSPGRPRRRRRS